MLRSNLTDAELTIGLRQAAEEIGIDLIPMMKGVGLNPQILERPQGYISWTKWNALLEWVATEHNCYYFGLLVASYQSGTKLGLMGQLMRLSPDVGAAIVKAQQYATTYSHTVYWETYFIDGFVTLNRKMHYDIGGPSGQCSTVSLAQAYKAMLTLCGPDWRPTEVRFVHPSPDATALRRYREFFKVPVSFSQTQDCLVFPASDLKIPVATADPQLLTIVEAHAANLQAELDVEQDLIGLVRFLIRKRLSSGQCNISYITDALEMHAKTLQRRLSENDYSFKGLLNEERHKLAQFYLSKSEISLSELAEILGYSEASAMSRAFKSISGMSPQQWRREFSEVL